MDTRTERERQLRYQMDVNAIHVRIAACLAEERNLLDGYKATREDLTALGARIGELVAARASATGEVCWCMSDQRRKKLRVPLLAECGPHSERHRLHAELCQHVARYCTLRRQYETQRETLRGLGLEEDRCPAE